MEEGGEGRAQESSSKRQRQERDSPDRPESSCKEALPANSEALEASVHQIQQKMAHFTQLVSELLEAGKAFFTEASTTFEQGIVQLHDKQMEKWEEELNMLRQIDAVNEDINLRLTSAQSLVAAMQNALA